jgi:hypothetical protein
MEPIWYTIRIVATVVMSGIGALLLWAAYEVSGNVNVVRDAGGVRCEPDSLAGFGDTGRLAMSWLSRDHRCRQRCENETIAATPVAFRLLSDRAARHRHRQGRRPGQRARLRFGRH